MKVASVSLILYIFCFIQPFTLKAVEGVGFVLGDPSGFVLNILSEKTKNSSLNFTLSWKTSSDRYLTVYADRLFYIPKEYKIKGYDLKKIAFFYGFGGGIFFDDGTEVAIRTPLEVKKDIGDIDVFLQLTPFLRLIDQTKGDVDIGLGVRYYFR